MNSLDWYEITKAKKMIKANDASSCGNAIAEYRNNIVILEHGANFRKYVIPKSKVERYDGTDIYLSEQSLLSWSALSIQDYVLQRELASYNYPYLMVH